MAFEVPEIQQSQRIANRIGLIDADCVAYWAAAGCDEMVVDAAYKKVRDRMIMITDQIQTDEIRCYLTGKNNFRNKIATYQMYKGNRYDKDGNRIKPQPKWLPQAREYILANYNSTLCDGYEADDALAMAQVKCNASQGWESIISSIDKDLLIIPGWHHDMNSGYVQHVTELGQLEIDIKKKVRGNGLKFFYAQLLMGDSADWIPGLPKVTPEMKERFDGIKRLGGCGQMAAYHVMHDADSEQELFNRAMWCYKTYWNGEHWYENWRTGEQVCPTAMEMLTEQGRLLWMMREPDTLWEPPLHLMKGYHEWTKDPADGTT
jgi:hypothetical protein